MICPKCGEEYREGCVECSDCHVPLMTRFPMSDAHPRGPAGIPPEFAPPLELVTVFRSGDMSKIMIAESILRSAEIEYLPRGKDVQSLFGVGSIGGMNIAMGPVQLQVRREDARDAEEMLAHLAHNEFDEEVGLEWENGDE